jgi:hypothetical protein
MTFSDESYRVDWNDPCLPNTLFFVSLKPFSHIKVSHEKCLFALSCLPVCPHTSAQLPLDGFLRNSELGTLTEICEDTTVLVKTRHQYWTLYTETSAHSYFCKLYEIFISWTIMQREPIVALTWQHIIIECCWQLHVIQEQYRGNFIFVVPCIINVFY